MAVLLVSPTAPLTPANTVLSLKQSPADSFGKEGHHHRHITEQWEFNVWQWRHQRIPRNSYRGIHDGGHAPQNHHIKRGSEPQSWNPTNHYHTSQYRRISWVHFKCTFWSLYLQASFTHPSVFLTSSLRWFWLPGVRTALSQVECSLLRWGLHQGWRPRGRDWGHTDAHPGSVADGQRGTRELSPSLRPRFSLVRKRVRLCDLKGTTFQHWKSANCTCQMEIITRALLSSQHRCED